ncbi:MAG TPA: hypothetical protein VGK23_00590 [Methanomassiliicoccales archaeon]|jgi:NRPS condensation-like uncharacterized protein
MQRQPASSLDLFTDSVRLMGDATMIAVMEFDRRLDMGRLFKASSQCNDVFPILGSKLVRGRGPAYWDLQQRQDSDEIFSVNFIEERDYRCHVPLAIDPYGNAQSKIRLLRTPDRDVIVINLAHAAADGFGLMVLANMLLQAYLDPSSVPRCSTGLPVRDTLWTAGLLDMCDSSKDAAEMNTSMWPSICGRSREPSLYHRAVIPPGEVQLIKEATNACGGTINDMLLSAYFLSMSDMTGNQGPQTISFPVNLRQHLTDCQRIMSNQAANVSFSIRREPGDRTEAILSKVVRETRRLKMGMVGIKEQVAFDRFCDPEGNAVHRMVEAMANKQNEGISNVFISNPGWFSLPAVDGLRDAYVCYPGSLMPSTCFVVSTFRGSMSVSMGYQNEDEPREATRRAIEGLVEHLPLDCSKVGFV